METLTKTIDVDDEIEELEDVVEDIEERIEERELEAVELDEQGEDGGERWQEIEEILTAYEDLLSTIRGRKRGLEQARDTWGGTEIVLRELTGSEVRRLKDDLRREAQQAGLDSLPDGAHETRFLEKAVESTPPGCPDPSDIGDLPNRLFEWLLGRANSLNTVGEFDMGNSSLSRRVAERQSQN